MKKRSAVTNVDKLISMMQSGYSLYECRGYTRGQRYFLRPADDNGPSVQVSHRVVRLAVDRGRIIARLKRGEIALNGGDVRFDINRYWK
jgi:hypothetical protein